MSADARPTAPPTLADDRAFLVAAGIRADYRPHAYALRLHLDGQLTSVPAESVEWLRQFAAEETQRGQTARRLLARVGGAS